jgi:thiamine biosynthesis lipoprotein
MNPLPVLCIVLSTALAVVGCRVGAPRTALERHEFTRVRMGVPARIVLYAPDATTARAAAESAYARIAALEDALSDWRVDSEVARLAAQADGSARAISPALASILATAQEVHAASAGAFDPTIGAATHLWRAARATGRFPSAAEWEAAQATSGWSRLGFDGVRGSVSPVAGLVIDCGGIAKGAAAEAALDELRRAGCARALVALAGDIAVGAAPPGAAGWRIDVELGLAGSTPRTLVLVDASVSTSGDREQALLVDGVRHSHLIDPRSGRPLTRRTACSVIAPRSVPSGSQCGAQNRSQGGGALADALASAACVLGIDALDALFAPLAGVRAYAAELRDGQRVEREFP